VTNGKRWILFLSVVGLFSGCSSGLLECLARTADDPVVASPTAMSLFMEDRVDVEWEADPGAERYSLERATDAANPVFGVVYRGGNTWYVDERLEDQTLYLYRLTKERGARSFGPSDPVLGVGSSTSRDEHEPNDSEESATTLPYDRISNLYFYRSQDGQVVQDADWYSVAIPARKKALVVIIYSAASDQTYFYLYEKGMSPKPVVNGGAIEISNTTYEEKTFLFKVYPLGDSFISDPSLGGGTLMNYTVSLYQITAL